jgi:hypothetical protein
MGDSQVTIDEHTTADGVLKNYELLTSEHIKFPTIFGKIIKSTKFSSTLVDDQILVADHNIFSNSTFAISLWVYFSVFDIDQYLFRKANIDANGADDTKKEFSLALTSQNTLVFKVYDETHTTGGSIDGFKQFIAQSALATADKEKWHNVVVTYAAGDANIYLNGTLIAIDTTASTGGDAFVDIENNDAPIRIGSGTFNGYMAEVAFWQYELTASEVTSIYNDGCPNQLNNIDVSLTNKLVSWWRMGSDEKDKIDFTGNLSSTNKIKDIVGSHDGNPGIPVSGFVPLPWWGTCEPDVGRDFVPFVLRTPGVPSLRSKPTPYKTNLH